MEFVNKSSNKRIGIIVEKVNRIIRSDIFKEKLCAVKSFKSEYTSSPEVNGTYVLSKLICDPSVVEVFTFKSKNPWTSSNGYTVQDKFTRMFLNTRKFSRSDASIGATIAHEGVHEVDNNDLKNSYNHGDNRPKGGTAPEIVADIVYEIMAGVKSTENSAIQ